MEYVILAIALVVFGYIAFRSTLWGAGTIIALLPSYLWRFEFYGLPTTFLELMILLLFLIWMFKDSNFKRINFSFSAQAINKVPVVARGLLTAWLAISIISLTVNPELAALGIWRAYFLEPMMFFLVLIYSIRNKNDLLVIFRCFIILLSLLFVVTFLQFINVISLPGAYDYPNVRRLTGIYTYPNALGLLTAPLTSFFAVLWLQSRNKKKKWPYAMATMMGLLMSVMAVSEGAIMGIFLALILWLILAPKTRKIAIPVLLVVVAVAFLFAPIVENIKSFQQQLLRPEIDLQATSLEIRSSQWSETWMMLSDNFLWGAGLAGYQNAIKPYHTEQWLEIYLYPHNIFLNFWSELGVIGMALLLSVLAYILWMIREVGALQNKYAWPLLTFWLTWFIHGLVDVPYFKNDLSILFFTFFAITILIYEERRKNKYN